MSIPSNLQTYVLTLNTDARECFESLKSLITDVFPKINIILFSKQPYFYLDVHKEINLHRRPSVMMAIYHDHINIFTTKNKEYKRRLSMYTFTEKNTLQIYFHQRLEGNVLKELFKDALNDLREKNVGPNQRGADDFSSAHLSKLKARTKS